MSIQLERYIEERIQSLEAGKFEQFIKQILPLIEERYIGLDRVGHNIYGKTKPGTPDLIKTFDNGDQIAVQCGTGKSYGKSCQETLGSIKCKPIDDINKCIKKLEKLVEIVLVYSHSFSNCDSNIKSNIIRSFQSKSFQITFFSGENLSKWIAENQIQNKVVEIIKYFFPDLMPFINQDSFGYFDFSSDGRLLIENAGENLLTITQFRIVDVNIINALEGDLDFKKFHVMIDTEKHEIRKGMVKGFLNPKLLHNLKYYEFNIFFETMEASFVQNIRLSKNTNGWSKATTVSKFRESNVLYEYTDPGFEPIIQV